MRRWVQVDSRDGNLDELAMKQCQMGTTYDWEICPLRQ